MRGHVGAGQQLASTVRRGWWPLLAVAAIAPVPKTRRWALAVTVGAIAAAPARAPTDLAYGLGVWIGMVRHRTWRPIVPALSAWPRPSDVAKYRRKP
jgi:hypothetical protein